MPTSLASTRVFDVIKILNVKLFVDFIFVRPGIICNIRKFAPIQNFPLYGILIRNLVNTKYFQTNIKCTKKGKLLYICAYVHLHFY